MLKITIPDLIQPFLPDVGGVKVEGLDVLPITPMITVNKCYSVIVILPQLLKCVLLLV